MDTEFELVSRFFNRLSLLGASTSSHDAIEAMSAFLGSVAALSFSGAEGTVHEEQSVSLASLSDFLAAIALSSATVRPPPPVFSVWRVTGIDRNEVRNTSVLAWALNPRASHGKGPEILNAFLDRLRRGRPLGDSLFPFPQDVADCLVITEASPFADQANRVDILFDGPGFTAFVEVKVDATPSTDQVKRYLALSEARAKATGRSRYGVIFLAPAWARGLPDLGSRVVTATWEDVGNAILDCVPITPGSSIIDTILRDFATHTSNF